MQELRIFGKMKKGWALLLFNICVFYTASSYPLFSKATIPTPQNCSVLQGFTSPKTKPLNISNISNSPTLHLHYSSEKNTAFHPILSLHKYPSPKKTTLEDSLFIDSSNTETPFSYYLNNWRKSIRTLTQDSADFIGLPYPYSTPTLAGNKLFREMYYWDTYFINVGLLAMAEKGNLKDSFLVQAKNNCDNLIYLVERFGFVPNANRFSMTNRSQPPFLSAMVSEIYPYLQDTVWLRRALNAVVKEHTWWMQNRFQAFHTLVEVPSKKRYKNTLFCDPTGQPMYGLNHYGHNADSVFIKKFSQFLKQRLGKPFVKLSDSLDRVNMYAAKILSGNMLAEAESGWDFTPRFNAHCYDVAAIDLNCLLFQSEQNIDKFYSFLGEKAASKAWQKTANYRKKMIYSFMYNSETGLFYDFAFHGAKQLEGLHAAQFFPYFVGLATQNKKTRMALLSHSQRFISIGGVQTLLQSGHDSAQNRVTWNTQWNQPNAWPCFTYIVSEGIQNYEGIFNKQQKNLSEIRFRINQNYLKTVESNFSKTGKFWEKYNAHNGSISVVNEYEMPAFFGWTAGIYSYYYKEYIGP